MSDVRVLRPVPDAARLLAPTRAMAPALDPAGPLRLALVANGKPNSVELLDALAAELTARWSSTEPATARPQVEVRRYRKGSVSVPPEPDDVEEITGWATAVIAALGD